MGILAGFMVPHPPMIVPEVGRESEERVIPTKEAYEKVAMAIQDLEPEVLAITCMTSHYFYPQLVRQVSVPILHGIRETAALLKEKGIKSAGILATSGAVRSGIYQETFQEYGIESVLPDAQAQRLVMELIYGRAKAGKPLSGDELMALSDHLKSRGAEIAVLGCTELSLANDEGLIPEDRKEEFQDVLEALALACIRSCREC